MHSPDTIKEKEMMFEGLKFQVRALPAAFAARRT